MVDLPYGPENAEPAADVGSLLLRENWQRDPEGSSIEPSEPYEQTERQSRGGTLLCGGLLAL